MLMASPSPTYGEERHRSASDSGMTREEARRIAAWIARSPGLVGSGAK
jgi:hypothetical protein